MSKVEKSRYKEAPLTEQTLSVIEQFPELFDLANKLVGSDQIESTADFAHAIFTGENLSPEGTIEVNEYINRLSPNEAENLMAALPTLLLLDENTRGESLNTGKKLRPKFETVDKLHTKMIDQETREDKLAEKLLRAGKKVPQIKADFAAKGWAWGSTRLRLLEKYNAKNLTQVKSALKNKDLSVGQETETPIITIETTPETAPNLEILNRVDESLQPLMKDLFDLYAAYSHIRTYMELSNDLDELQLREERIMDRYPTELANFGTGARRDKVRGLLQVVADHDEFNYPDIFKFAADNHFGQKVNQVEGAENSVPEEEEHTEVDAAELVGTESY